MALDKKALAAAKRYVASTADSLGSLKGAPCTIKSITEVDGGQKVTFEWTGTSGTKQTSEMTVKNGVSITDVELNTNDELVITLSDGTTKNIGVLPTIKGVSPTIKEDAGNNADVYKLVIKDVNGTITTPNLKASSSGDGSYQLIEKYSKLGNSYTTSKIAYVQTDETISSVKYKKGFYEFDVTTTTWNYLGEQNNVHSNRKVIDKFNESDVLDTDGITVLYKQPTFDNKELLFKTDIGDVNVYAYKTGTTYKKDDIVLNGAILYVALRDTQDTTKITEDDFVAISSNGSIIEKYVSGTDYKIGQYVIKDNDIYECIALQADNTVFDDVNEFKLISNYVLDSKPLTMDDLVDSSVVIAVPYTGDTNKTVTSDYVYKTLSDIIPKLHVKTQDELYHEIYEYTTAYYELSSVGTDGALEVVSDGTSPLTDTQIEESNVAPVKEGQTVTVGDYVILVESQKTDVTKFVPRDELDTVPTKDSKNRLTSGSVYSSLFETKHRTVIDTPENYIVCVSSDDGALEVVADDVVPTATQVTLSVVQVFVPTAQVGEYYQHIDEVSHVEGYEDTIYREKDDSYSSVEVDEKIKEVNDRITDVASGGLKPLSLTDYQSFMNNLVISADGYVAP